MKASTILGLVSGMAVATIVIGSMYPDVYRRMQRDCKKKMKCGKKLFQK